jgi:hypothetical protein
MSVNRCACPFVSLSVNCCACPFVSFVRSIAVPVLSFPMSVNRCACPFVSSIEKVYRNHNVRQLLCLFFRFLLFPMIAVPVLSFPFVP